MAETAPPRCRTCRHATPSATELTVDCAKGQGYGIDANRGCAQHEPIALHVFTDDVETYVAKDLEDALALQRETTGMKACDQEIEMWAELADIAPVTIHTGVDGDGPVVTKTAAEWAASNGRGFLCSTEY